MIRRYRVEIVAVGMTSLGELRVVVATTDHDGSGRESPLGDEASQRGLQVGDVAHFADGRCGQVGEAERRGRGGDVAVRVDEARQQCRGAEFHDPRAVAAVAHD